MKAKYTFVENPNPKGDGKKQPLHVRLVSNGTVSTEQLFNDIAHASSYTVADLEGMLRAISDQISDYLVQGFHVELRDIGFFSATLQSRQVMDKKEIRSDSVFFDSINFRPAASFRKQVSGYVESAGKNGFQLSSQLSEAERKKCLNAILDEKGYITRTHYSSVTGRLKNLALSDLNSFVDQGILKKEGRGNRIFFVRPKADNQG